MKKTVSLAITLMLIVLTLTGCGSSTQEQQAAVPTATEATIAASTDQLPLATEQPVTANIDWHTETVTWTDNDGYSYEATLRMSPWILRSNSQTINSAWRQLGASAILPLSDSDWGIKRYNNNTSQRQLSSGYGFSAISMNDMYYSVGSFSVRNITNGWNLTEDNKKSPIIKVNPYCRDEYFDSPFHPSQGYGMIPNTSGISPVISRIFYGDHPSDTIGLLNFLPSMSSNNWGPVYFVIAHAESFSPNSPSGNYRQYLEKDEFRVEVWSSNTGEMVLARFELGIMD